MGSLSQLCCTNTSAKRDPKTTSINIYKSEIEYNYLTPEEIKKNNEKLNIKMNINNKKSINVSVINPIYASGIIE